LDILKKEGLLKKEEQLGQNTVMVSAEKTDAITNILEKFHIKYSVRKIWE